MLKIVVCVSGGGTNLQAIIDGIADGTITNTEIVGVISNNKNAYALERAKKAGIFAECISPKDYETREMFNDALLDGVYGDTESEDAHRSQQSITFESRFGKKDNLSQSEKI